MRQGPRRVAGRALRDQVLDDRDLLHHLRYRVDLHLAVGHALPAARLVRIRRDARLPGRAHAGLSLHLAQAGFAMGVGSFFTGKLDEAIGWARKYSIFQYPFLTGCCGMELVATSV